MAALTGPRLGLAPSQRLSLVDSNATIDAPKLHDVGTLANVMARSDVQSLGGGVKIARMFATIDAPKLHAVGNLANVMARSDAQSLGGGVKIARMFATIDAPKLHAVGNLANVMARSDAQSLGGGVKIARMFATIDAPKLHAVGNLANVMARSDAQSLGGGVKIARMFATIDAPKLHAVGNLANVMARSDAQSLGGGVKIARMFATIDAPKLHAVGNLAELVADVTMPALRVSPPTKADLISDSGFPRVRRCGRLRILRRSRPLARNRRPSRQSCGCAARAKEGGPFGPDLSPPRAHPGGVGAAINPCQLRRASRHERVPRDARRNRGHQRHRVLPRPRGPQ